MPISSALGSSALLPAGLGFRNLIQNGNMVVDQRSIASSPITNTAAASTTALDRWNFYGSLAKMTMTQSTDVPSTEVFTKSLKITTAASTFTPGAGDYYGVRQVIEGQNFAAAGYGTSAAKPLVLSFWVKCSTTGTFSVSLFNREAPDRSYVSTYVINSANTWEKKIIYIQSGDTSGTWLTTSGIGLQLWWDLGSGSSQNATAGVWNSSLKVNTSSQPNFVGTNAGTFYLTGVQLEQNYQPTPFEQRPIGTELALCQRYYYRLGNTSVSGAYLVPSNNIVYSASAVEGCLQHPVPMRTSAVTLGSNSVYAYNVYQGNWVGIPRAAVSSSNSTTHAVIITDRSGGTSWSTFVTGTTQMAFALIANTSAGYIEVSAEL
jgi:hypothetical protein